MYPRIEVQLSHRDGRIKQGQVNIGNHIVAGNGSVAIHLASPPQAGTQRIEQNTISGFAQGVTQERGR